MQNLQPYINRKQIKKFYCCFKSLEIQLNKAFFQRSAAAFTGNVIWDCRAPNRKKHWSLWANNIWNFTMNL